MELNEPQMKSSTRLLYLCTTCFFELVWLTEHLPCQETGQKEKKSRGQVEKEGRIGAVVFFFKATRKQKLDQTYIQEIRQLHMYVCCIPSLMKEILTSTNLHCKNLSVLEKRMNFPHCVLQPAAGSFRWDG